MIDILNDQEGMKRLLKLGATSVPVVAVGDKFAYGLQLDQVAKLINREYIQNERLSPQELVTKISKVLDTARLAVKQIPDVKLGEKVLPKRPRSWFQLSFHIFKIVDIFLDTMDGKDLTVEDMRANAPETLTDITAVSDYGTMVLHRFKQWSTSNIEKIELEQEFNTFYGTTTFHEFLERTAWHSAQHVRQVLYVLEQLNIGPVQTLTKEDLTGLPLPQSVWDE